MYIVIVLSIVASSTAAELTENICALVNDIVGESEDSSNKFSQGFASGFT